MTFDARAADFGAVGDVDVVVVGEFDACATNFGASRDVDTIVVGDFDACTLDMVMLDILVLLLWVTLMFVL